MMTDKIFWELINKNKKNPEQFIKESEKLTLEELFEFDILFHKFTNELQEHEEFIMDMCIEYDLVGYIEREDEDRIIFLSAYDYLFENIVFRGEELFNAFINEDECKIVSILSEMEDQLSSESADISLIFEAGAVKMCKTDEEIKQLYDNKYDDLYNEYIDKFYEAEKEYIKNKEI